MTPIISTLALIPGFRAVSKLDSSLLLLFAKILPPLVAIRWLVIGIPDLLVVAQGRGGYADFFRQLVPVVVVPEFIRLTVNVDELSP
jgi:hypothetical protein